MRYYIGTSGWSYDWNIGEDLTWYVTHSGLNAVELNASFYRFPFENYIKSWMKNGKNLRWSIKVHRSVTHNHKFNEKAREVWGRFLERFSPMDHLIDFYLFQAPPHYQNIARIQSFLDAIPLKGRIALELRDPSLLSDDDVCTELQRSAVLVSVDSPEFLNRIFHGETIYLRIHGRDDWYDHDYTKKELEELLEIILQKPPKRLYVFFNNDHHMIENARLLLEILQE